MMAPASDAVRAQWERQVSAEYRSSALAQQLTLWLTQIGASPDLIEAGLRIAQDELDHARESFEVYRAAGGLRAVALERPRLVTGGGADEDLELQVLDAAVTVFCLGETVAVPLFRHLRSGCDNADAGAVLDRIVNDEPRHSSFGWDLLDWLLDGPCAGREDRVQHALVRGFRGLDRAYGHRGVATTSAFPDADRAWGLAPRREYAGILDTTFGRVWRRRFAAHGIDAEPAWNDRTSWHAQPASDQHTGDDHRHGDDGVGHAVVVEQG